MKLSTPLAVSLLLGLGLLSSAVTQRPAAEDLAVLKFVQGFYDWYTPVALGEHSVPADVLALKSRRSDFTVKLARALAADEAAQAKASGEIVGLDFDPFLNSQDPDKRYQVGKIMHTGQRFLVEIHGVVDGKAVAKPEVVADVVRVGGKYRFENFLYPENGGNLLSVLKTLAAERHRPEDR